MNSVVLPRLDLPFASRINSATSSLEEHVMRWVQGSETLPESAIAPWSAGKYHRLVGRMYPNAPLPELSLISEAVLWLFLVDDHLDPGMPGDDPERARSFVQGTRAILGSEMSTVAPADPLLRCLWSIQKRLVPLVRAAWWERCSRDLWQFADSIQQEVCARAEGGLPSPRTYLERRRFTSGWLVLTDLVEVDTQAELADDVRSSPLHEELRAISGDIACGINDILSLRKELAAGEVHNIVLLFQRAEACSLTEALEQVSRWIADRLRDYENAKARFLALCGEVPVPPGQVGAAGYAAGLENLMRGSLDWSLESGRYATAATNDHGEKRPQ